MKKIYPVNKDESLKENIRNILPMMYDEFMSHKEIIVNFPLRKNHLHKMRISGKPLRYTMELGEYCFGSEFKTCHNEVKDVLELMGEIHDADVMVPEISLHIKEIRLFNQTLPDVKQRFSPKTLSYCIKEKREQRRNMYGELCAKLNSWAQTGFKERLTSSMRKEADAAVNP